MTADSDCNNSQSNKDEDCDNCQSDNDDNSQFDEDEDRAVCGIIYPDDGGFWIGCDGCNYWLTLKVQTSRVKSMFQMSNTVNNVECEQFLTILSSVS